MAKDPAFLFYSKDWIEGTAELSPEAKGVYIDLLCYQHQRGDLPTESVKLRRLVRMGEEEFKKAWQEIERPHAELPREYCRQKCETSTQNHLQGIVIEKVI